MIAGSELLANRDERAESKKSAARSAVGALNSVGPPKKSSRKYTLGESSESMLENTRERKKRKCVEK